MKCALRELAALVVGVLVGFLPVPSAAESERGPAGCAGVAAVEQAAAQPTPSRTPEDLRRPMTEQEVEQLVRAMEPVDVDGGAGRAIRATVEGSPLARERLAVLLADATAVLAEIHARESLDRLKSTRGLATGARARAGRTLTAVRECVRARFGDRGGDRPFAESVRLVEKHRAALERVLLQGVSAGEKPDARSRGAVEHAAPATPSPGTSPGPIPGPGPSPGPSPGPAQNATLEVTQETLNSLLGRLGSLADAGVYQPTASPALGTGQNCQPLGSLQCPSASGSQPAIPLLVCSEPGGAPAIVPGSPAVPWQWRVSDARFTLAAGSMTFTAAVHTRVGGQTNTDTRTVPASVSFDAASDRLRANIGAFTVPLQLEGVTITEADVAKLYSISLPLEPQEFSIALPEGGNRTVVARGAAITAAYLPGKLQVGVDVAFAPPGTGATKAVDVAFRPPAAAATTAVDVASTPPAAAATMAVHSAQFSPLAPGVDKALLIPTGRSILRIYESTFNELAEGLEPLKWSGSYKYRVCTFSLGGECLNKVTICESNYVARITNLRFDITPSKISITGDVNAQWCGVGFNATFDTTASVTYKAVSDAVHVTVAPTSIQPVLNVGGYEVPLPIHMDVAPSLTFPPVPVSTGFFHFTTAGGPIALRLSPSHVSLSRRNGYLELRAHVSLW